MDCHEKSENHFKKAASFKNGAEGCLKCHEDYGNMLNHQMVTREKEKKYAKDTFSGFDKKFFDKTCSSCHVQSCTDCHGSADKPHEIVKPTTETCQECHRDYYIGIEYSGLGQREDHERYDRGIEYKGGKYASMLEDVHFEAGLDCGDCHSMKSLAEGKKSSKSCTDCHDGINDSIEHSIPEHMEKMECYTCHSAWANQEYGTFWIKFEESGFDEYFRWVKRPHIDFAKSSHTKQYTDFPIGINKDGKYSPLRPEFITFTTHIKGKKVVGVENRMVSNFYKAVFPHTVRRGTVLCESCHANDKRLMYAKDKDRIFHLDKDGLMIRNFFNKDKFRVSNGRFINDEEYKIITDKSPEYKRLVVKKWDQVINAFKEKD
jgi:hypothetical protein